MDVIGPFVLLALFLLGLTVWRVRRREYRELLASYAWAACTVAGLSAIVLLPAGWSTAVFWTMMAVGVAALFALLGRRRPA